MWDWLRPRAVIPSEAEGRVESSITSLSAHKEGFYELTSL